eukprot:11164666-Lingulodinium_polyedra.AAC.1
MVPGQAGPLRAPRTRRGTFGQAFCTAAPRAGQVAFGCSGRCLAPRRRGSGRGGRVQIGRVGP